MHGSITPRHRGRGGPPLYIDFKKRTLKAGDTLIATQLADLSLRAGPSLTPDEGTLLTSAAGDRGYFANRKATAPRRDAPPTSEGWEVKGGKQKERPKKDVGKGKGR